ncbi:uncharacterized protein [Spinacia oleracea]|uniref:Uncharacterized protein n=1 Tax=Spinacia oleracea TaxID=3562 RepID=A0A9R0JXP5_SPIOL|nr:uncharacterized protein LOC110789910 [Spinacia oleracea]
MDNRKGKGKVNESRTYWASFLNPVDGYDGDVDVADDIGSTVRTSGQNDNEPSDTRRIQQSNSLTGSHLNPIDVDVEEDMGLNDNDPSETQRIGPSNRLIGNDSGRKRSNNANSLTGEDPKRKRSNNASISNVNQLQFLSPTSAQAHISSHILSQMGTSPDNFFNPFPYLPGFRPPLNPTTAQTPPFQSQPRPTVEPSQGLGYQQQQQLGLVSRTNSSVSQGLGYQQQQQLGLVSSTNSSVSQGLGYKQPAPRRSLRPNINPYPSQVTRHQQVAPRRSLSPNINPYPSHVTGSQPHAPYRSLRMKADNSHASQVTGYQQIAPRRSLSPNINPYPSHVTGSQQHAPYRSLRMKADNSHASQVTGSQGVSNIHSGSVRQVQQAPRPGTNLSPSAPDLFQSYEEFLQRQGSLGITGELSDTLTQRLTAANRDLNTETTESDNTQDEQENADTDT